MVVVVAMTSGCSYVAGTRTKPRGAHDSRCSRTAPIVDTVIAVPLLAVGTAGLIYLGSERNTQIYSGVVVWFIVPPLLVGGLSAASATYGFAKARRCEELHFEAEDNRDEYEEEAEDVEGAVETVLEEEVEAEPKRPPTPAAPVEKPIDPEVLRVARARDREAAWQLTKQAAAAARNDDCATVGSLAERVRTLDADFHDTVFVRDVAISRCLSAPPSP